MCGIIWLEVLGLKKYNARLLKEARELPSVAREYG